MSTLKYTEVHGIELARHRDRIAMFVENLHGDRRAFEPESVAAWLELQDPDLAAIDVGAYTGLFSILAAKAGAAEVVALEPNPKAVHRLNHNIRRNHVKDLVDVFDVAASAFTGQGKLEIGGTEGRGISSTSKLVPGEGTNVVTLDDLIEYHMGAEIGSVKIDVEGHELSVLTGAVKLLEHEHPPLIIEVESEAGDREAEISAFLSTFDYDGGEELDGRNRLYRKLPN